MRIQMTIMRLLDKYRPRKVLAAEINVSESELSRWGAGSRGMPLDHFIEILRLDRYSNPQRVTDVLTVICEELDHKVQPSAVATTSGHVADQVLDVVARAGEVAAEVRRAQQDGVLDADEVRRLIEAARDLEHSAQQLRRAASRLAGVGA